MVKKVNPSDYIGKRFEKLVIKDVYSKSLYGKRRSVALCECDCGNPYEAEVSALNAGRRKDCGCSRHGMKGTRFYDIWCGVIKRCTNENASNYKGYGGRGIKVCNRWNEFINFKKDMYNDYLQASNKYGEKNISIERLNNDGNYDKANCVWATRKTQNNNSRQVTKYLWKGKNLSLSEIASQENINYRTLRNRFIYGNMSLEESVTKPVKKMVKADV